MHSEKIQKSLESKIVQARKENLRQMGDIEHRLEYVDGFHEVEYINDAKATDINSTWYSLEGLQKPVVWIAETSQYEDDNTLHLQMETDKIRAIIILGNNPEFLEAAFANRVELMGRVNTLSEAVEQASLVSEPGDVVLYSPSCSDFDNYSNYKEKGQRFRKAVRETSLS